MTFSIFLLSGNELRATIALDGPLAGTAEIDSGASLQKAAEKYDQTKRTSNRDEALHFSAEVDFEHLNLVDDDAEEGEDGVATDADGKAAGEDGDDDAAIAKRAAEGGAATEETPEERRARRARDRRKALEKRQREEQRKHKQRRKVRKEGEPDERTFAAPQEGWYRLCVTASFQTITVEMDLRKSSELGGVDPKTKHVLTFEQKAIQEEDRLLEQDTASQEGIKDEDFLSTREKLKSLRRLLADIQDKQTQERHRVLVHAATNEHSHSRMVLSSLMETILFMLVTGYQVYTIRKWFKGAPVLGR
jgi:emp24/gp25L/p24 family/GOLD